MNNYNAKQRYDGYTLLGVINRIAGSPMRSRRSNDALPHITTSSGYTLVETLVAVMLLGIALTIVLQQFSGSLNAGRLSGEYNQAIWYAREKMDEIQLNRRIPMGLHRGQIDNRYLWEAEIQPRTSDPSPGPNGLIPLDIRVQVSWRHGLINKKIEFNTIALTTSSEKG